MSNSPPDPMVGLHGFLIVGMDNLFLSHLPMFSAPEHAFQMILEVDLPKKDVEIYKKTKDENPDRPLIIVVQDKSLEDLSNSESFESKLCFANEDGDPVGKPLIESSVVHIKKTLLFNQLNPNQQYPEKLTYYLYGANSDFHLSHMLSKAPNFEQEIDVTLSGKIIDKTSEASFKVMKVSIPSLSEKEKQPITEDPLTQLEYSIEAEDGATGNISIKKKYWINNGPLNMDMHGHGMNMNHMNM